MCSAGLTSPLSARNGHRQIPTSHHRGDGQAELFGGNAIHAAIIPQPTQLAPGLRAWPAGAPRDTPAQVLLGYFVTTSLPFMSIEWPGKLQKNV